jgi:hypothetical protein
MSRRPRGMPGIICANQTGASPLLPKGWVGEHREPLRALVEGILVTPALVRLSPPVGRIVGDLSDRAIVRRALGLEAKVK